MACRCTHWWCTPPSSSCRWRALVALVYAAVPRWRWATRWPMVGLTAVALASIMTAYFSGRNFLSQRPELEQLSAVQLHRERAGVLFWVTIVFAVLVGLAAWGLGGPRGWRRAGSPAAGTTRWSSGRWSRSW